MKKLSLIAIIVSTLTYATVAESCSRITFKGGSDTVITGRSMDWYEDDHLVLHIMPKDKLRHSSDRTNNMSWVSKYGSVVGYSMGKGPNSGMNEKGLQVDVLYLEDSNYNSIKEGKKAIPATDFVQYLLDNYSSVQEIIRALQQKEIRLTKNHAMPLSGSFVGVDEKLHFIATDSTGQNIIIEAVDGKLNFYHRDGTTAITNEPPYPVMEKFYEYYTNKGVSKNMPGSSDSVDRFIRAKGWVSQLDTGIDNGFINLIPNKNFDMQARMSVLSIMRNVSTPIGISELSKQLNPNNCATIWRSVSDLKNKSIMFDLASSPTTVWVDLTKINFSNGERIFSLSDGKIKSGDISDQFSSF
ncbi:linear amide C-N hydrolase (plasmid) [Escherichia coli]|uniref:linear amide C-N hydrolase n=1 Tax=Escherichia coli TaxID=562 RepID=UPI001CA63B3F|nr:linear amide C-N hydrolase [Escherichia coli]QZZ09197.1 linear amide C-N hydrolase [Escherichia coli]